MTLAPGKYYIGDPCYALSEESYQEFLNLVLSGSDVLEGEFCFTDGTRFAVFNTLWGDGYYSASNNHRYPVDAGCLSAIPISKCDAKKLDEYGDAFTIEDFETIFEAKSNCSRRSGDGTITFGHIRIETGEYEDEDEDMYS